VTNRNDFEIGS